VANSILPTLYCLAQQNLEQIQARTRDALGADTVIRKRDAIEHCNKEGCKCHVDLQGILIQGILIRATCVVFFGLGGLHSTVSGHIGQAPPIYLLAPVRDNDLPHNVDLVLNILDTNSALGNKARRFKETF